MAASPLVLRKERDVADVLNATFRFIRHYWLLMLKTMFYFGGPPLIVAAGLGGGGIGALLLSGAFESGGESSGAALGLLGLAVVVGTIAMFVASGLTFAGIFGIIRLHDEQGFDTFGVRDVWPIAKSYALRMIGIGAVFAGSVLLAFPLLIIPCLNIFLMAALYVALMSKWFFMGYPISVLEDRGVFASLKRSSQLVKGEFWPTAGIVVVVYVAQQILTYAFMIPMYAVLFAAGFNSPVDNFPTWLGMIMGVLGLVAIVGILLITAITYVAGAMQYFSLTEKKENTSLQQRVDEMSRSAPDAAPPDATADPTDAPADDPTGDPTEESPATASSDDSSGDSDSANSEAAARSSNADRWRRRESDAASGARSEGDETDGEGDSASDPSPDGASDRGASGTSSRGESSRDGASDGKTD